MQTGIIANNTDRFGKYTKYNGSIKYDGHTVNDYIFIRSKYDGRHKYNGQSKYNGVRKVIRDYPIRPTFKYSSFRTVDKHDISVRFDGFRDAVLLAENIDLGIRYHHKYNGKYKYDGKIKYNSMVLKPLEG
jgi:hypothetical protein